MPCVRPPPGSPCTTRRSCCSPTSTARRSPPAPTGWNGSSAQVSAPVRWEECMDTMAAPGRERPHRAAARRHPDRPGPAGAARGGDAGPEDPGRPGRRRASLLAEHGTPEPVRQRPCARMAAAGRRRRTAPSGPVAMARPLAPGVARPLRRAAGARRGPRRPARHHARPSRPPSWSGWSRTATRSTLASRWSGCCRMAPSEAHRRQHGRGVPDATDRGLTGCPDPRVRRLPAGQGRHQRRPGGLGRHHRRVDPQPGRHRQQADRRPGRDRRGHGRGRRR